jgi:hypothetical protein
MVGCENPSLNVQFVDTADALGMLAGHDGSGFKPTLANEAWPVSTATTPSALTASKTNNVKFI